MAIPVFCGCPSGSPGDRHHPAHPLHDVVVARARRVGARLAEPGDRTVDQPRVDLGEGGVVEPVFLQPAKLEVFDQDVRVRRQTAHGGAPLLGTEIGGDRAFAPVAAVEIGGRSVAVAVDERRAPGARVVARRGFHLDHIRPEIGQCLTGPGAGQNTREFEDLQPVERGALIRRVSRPGSWRTPRRTCSTGARRR